jgi:phosphoribosylformylglycinamidine (FGAM) synthase-like amidotransferase family enzyme
MSPHRPETCVITGFGINADEELARAFSLAGAEPLRVHVRDLIGDPKLLLKFRILAFPGGFSFGDHLGSGKVFATLFRRNLGGALSDYIAGGGLVIGICNGFQVLVKMGVLPNLSGTGAQEASLVHNDSGKFEDRWVRVRFDGTSRCVWSRGLREMELPVRHGEGKFILPSPSSLDVLATQGLVALRYAARDGEATEPASFGYPDDPNGSEGHVAGICDPTGRVFGLMPHPEAYMCPENHPDWARLDRRTVRELERNGGDGLRIFRNGVLAALER